MWREATLGDLGDVITGGTPAARNADWFGDEVPFITPTDIGSNDRRARVERWLSEAGRGGFRKKVLPPGSVCFVSIGATIGKLCLTDAEAVTNQQINSVVPASDVDGRFLYYLLRHEAPRIAQMAGGAATPIINKTAFSNVSVLVPDSGTQTRIGLMLGVLDDLIENNRRRVGVLEEMARAVYREWFVHFRFPGHESVDLIDSELGPIPDGWEVRTVGDVLGLKYGKALKADARAGGDVAVVGSSGIVGWHNQTLVMGPVIVVGRKGNVGSVIWIEGPCWPIDTTYFVETELPLRFVAEQLRRTEFLNTHAAVPGLGRDQAYSKPFLQPPPKLLDEFQSVADSLATEASALSSQNKRLVSMRDLLLPKLVTGQIDVSRLDLDALVEGAVA
jgi:type I restriction enzyme S subunit